MREHLEGPAADRAVLDVALGDAVAGIDPERYGLAAVRAGDLGFHRAPPRARMPARRFAGKERDAARDPGPRSRRLVWAGEPGRARALRLRQAAGEAERLAGLGE